MDSNGEVVNESSELSGIFLAVSKGDTVEVQKILSENPSIVDQADDHGMTPLEHAAYRGNAEMCRILVDCGAEVNGGNHNNGYTALHFAALSGNSNLCLFLLKFGARASAINSVGRTASQMGAFVGNHHCSSVINSYIDRKEIDYFSVPQGLEETPKLDPQLVPFVHNLLLQSNFHPVRIALYLQEEELPEAKFQQVLSVLPLIVEREMQKGAERNEVVGLKVHMIHSTLSQIDKISQEEKVKDKSRDPYDVFIKNMLKADPPGSIPEKLDIFLRQAVRSFPFVDTAIMQQLVTNLTQVKVREEPGAWSIISSIVNGQKGFQDNEPCVVCGEERGVKRCARCHQETYCSKDCQKLHWFIHKKNCAKKELSLRAVPSHELFPHTCEGRAK